VFGTNHHQYSIHSDYDWSNVFYVLQQAGLSNFTAKPCYYINEYFL